MKKTHFIIGLIIIIVFSLIVSSQIQEGATVISTTTVPQSSAVTSESIKIVETIMNGTLMIDPISDKNYKEAITKYKCFIPPGGTPLTPDYTPFSGNKPKFTYTFNESATANDTTTKKIGLIPHIVTNMLNMSSFDPAYPYQGAMEPLVFYTAYLVNLQKNISIIAKSKDTNAITLLKQLLDSNTFIYDDGKKQYALELDELILYVDSLLGNAFNTGKYKSKLEADFLCNFNTTNTTSVGIMQKVVPLLFEDFETIGFSNVPPSLAAIEVAPLNGSDIQKFAKKKK